MNASSSLLFLALLLTSAAVRAACLAADFSPSLATTVTRDGCFTSKATGSEVLYAVTFPAGYRGKDVASPYAIFLHGRASSRRQFVESGGERALDLHVRSGGQPFLVIAPSEPKHSYWKDGPKGEFGTATMVTRDLIAHLEKHGAVARTSGDRALMGISMGGHGTVYLALREPDLFGQAYALSPIFRRETELDPADKPAFGAGRAFSRQDPVSWFREARAGGRVRWPARRFCAEIGRDDGLLDQYDQTRSFLLEIQGVLKGDAVDLSRPGGHDGVYWGAALARAVAVLGEGFRNSSFRGCTPASRGPAREAAVSPRAAPAVFPK